MGSSQTMTGNSRYKVREAVAVFHDEQAMDAAVDDLEEHGFDRAEISLMASEKAVQAKLGDRYQRVEDAADDPSTPRTFLVTPEEVGAGRGALVGGLAYVGAVAAAGAVVASGGALLVTSLAALAAGAGSGMVGSVLARRLGERHAREIEDHLKHGGLLIWVGLRDTQREETAVEILSRHTDEPVKVHEIDAFDPEAGPGPDLEPVEVGLPWLFRMRRQKG
jgi:hypothetical protein